MFSLKSIGVGLFTLASWVFLVTPSLAQINNSSDPNYQKNEYDSLTGTSGFNPMDLIHRANMSTSRNGEQFQEDTNRNINDAAADFKRQQQEQWQNQSVSQPAISSPGE